ncbi:MAG: PP2C family protein-serine/threonine phosphatase [Rhodocyclaceae bacterium]
MRARNEDALHVDAGGRFAVLADGMGGYRGGDVASSLSVETVANVFGGRGSAELDSDAAARLAFDATLLANAEIYRAGRRNPSLAGMGSTLLIAVFLADELLSAHVGDSRLYRMRAGGLRQLTRDHTMLQEQVDAGLIDAEEASRFAYRGLLTRGLGVADEVVPDLGFHDIQADDVFLLCSDGLTDMLDDQRIAVLLGAGDDVQRCAEALVEAANLQGGRDNVSAIVARLVV